MIHQDADLLNELILESREHLQEVEPDLLALERDPAGAGDELINRLFRAVHSIKGGFGFFGIEAITKLSHSMESVLARVRSKELAPSEPITDALLLGVDKLRVLLDDVSAADQTRIEEELERLNPFMVQQSNGCPAASASSPEAVSLPGAEPAQNHPDLTRAQLNEVLHHGKTVYELTVGSNQDMLNKGLTPVGLVEKWQVYGDILDTMVDFSAVIGLAGSSEQELFYSLIFASVLEPDLICEALGIDASCVRILEIPRHETPGHARTEPAAQAIPAAAKHESAAPPPPVAENTMEEALRVRVRLLNVLMDLAGELVLSRNQLMQSLNRNFNTSATCEAVARSAAEEAARVMTAACEAVRAGGQTSHVVREAAAGLRKRLMDMLSFRLLEVHGLGAITQNLDMVTSTLQENIMLTRMQPVGVVFNKFPRIIRDLSKKLCKEINLTLIGQEIELDKSIVEMLSDPLTHLVRNAVDHGIESPEERVRRGKSAQGQVILRAYHEGGKVNIEMTDDGKGIQADTIREHAVQKGIITAEEAERMSTRDLQMLIFAPGFSTSEKVTDLSGRGVGMDVVKTNIERLGGAVEVESEQGEGTRFVLKLPLTLAIIPSLIVETEGRLFAVPQVSLEEIVRVRAQEVTRTIERIGDAEVMRLRDHLLPLVRLSRALGIEPTFDEPAAGAALPDRRERWSDRRSHEQSETAAGGKPVPPDHRIGSKDRRCSTSNAVKIIVLRVDRHQFGLAVDTVLESEEIVVKPLSAYLKSCQCYSGAAIMGDGRVAMILDPSGIASVTQLKFPEAESGPEIAEAAAAMGAEQQGYLLFDTGGAERFAVPLPSVARIEKRKREEIQTAGGRQFVTYESSILRVISLHEYLPVSPPAAKNGHVYIIVPKGMKRQIGVVAAHIADIVQVRMTLDQESVTGPGIAGSGMINGALTVVLDVKGLGLLVEPDSNA